jgi:hypothetical protein
MMYRRNRKNTRRDRKNSRKNTRRDRKNYRKQSGGVAPVEYVMGQDMSAQSLAQGKQFLAIHANQHGGAHGYEGGPFPGSVQEQSLLPSELHASARVAPLDAAIREIQGMKDQAGGRRNRKTRKANRKSRKANRKTNRKANRKTNRKTNRKNRKQNGGSYKLDSASPYDAPSMLLPSGLESKALGGMNAEWALAKNPASFAPGL